MSKRQFERAAYEFLDWRCVPSDERSPAPGWWWQPAFEVRNLNETMTPLCCRCFELPVGSIVADGANVLMAALANQTSLSWPDEFPRKRRKIDPLG